MKSRLKTFRNTDPKHIFISYARADGSDYALRLHGDLTAHGYDGWMDNPDIDKERDFTAEIEQAIEAATHMLVVLTPSIKKPDSFVRLEIAYALKLNVPIIPLMFPDGHRPITIINHTYIDFRQGWTIEDLLTRLADPDDVTNTPPASPREREMVYLENIAQQRVFSRWRIIYTAMAAEVHLPHDQSEIFDDVREAIRREKRVTLVGDPGMGKTTTLERLTDELASEAVEDENAPLPLFAGLGAFEGGGLDDFLASRFGDLSLDDYLPERLFLLLDDLNEMQPEHLGDVDAWLRDHPEVPVVVSCRTLDYVDLKLPLQRVDVLPLDIEQQYLFIGNFFANEADREALFWSLAGSENRSAWEWFKDETNDTFYDFWHSEAGDEPPKSKPEKYRIWLLRTSMINNRSHLLTSGIYGILGVTSNPFLLSIIVRLYATSGKPHQNRGQLFEGFVRMLFKERGKPAAAVRGPWIDEEIQRKGLAAIAYRMRAERTGTTVDRQWAIRVIYKALPNQDAEYLLYLAGSASILELGTKIRFTPPILQDYFAALEMGTDMRSGASAKKYWPHDKQWWQETGWEEPAVLLAGITRNAEGDLDATPVVEWLTPVQPRLAYRCIIESGADCDDTALQTLYEAEPPQRVAPLAKLRWGNILVERGDHRPGVGLTNGIPNIAWVNIPAGKVSIEGQIFDVKPFRLAKYPITTAQYHAFVNAPDGYSDIDWWNYSEAALTWRSQNLQPHKGEWPIANRPRERVNWYEGVAFSRWLSTKIELNVRLPTEWEWQWAAQGYQVSNSANEISTLEIPNTANIGLQETCAVGIFTNMQNSSVADMNGNIWEWCLNKYVSLGTTSLSGTHRRVLRGGSFYFDASTANHTFRGFAFPNTQVWDIGFRVATDGSVVRLSPPG